MTHTISVGHTCALFCLGFDLGCVLPEVEDLLSSPSLLEVGVAQGTQFQFLVRAGFEQLQRLQQNMETV